jgi:protoporphyrinogen oxidase
VQELRADVGALPDTGSDTVTTEDVDLLVLGGGLAGLSIAVALGPRAVVLERAARPGGLARTECLDGYWFDHVIHVLYFPDDQTEQRVRSLLGEELQPLRPNAAIETASGRARYPLQHHLGSLRPDVAVRCAEDFARAALASPSDSPRNYLELLRGAFGDALCETFFVPYNDKVWKRPLDTLAPSGFQWNVTRPTFAEVLHGLVEPQAETLGYNSAGWYPVPPAGADCRGMECLSNALAEEASALLLEHEVESIDLAERIVVARHRNRRIRFRYHSGCCSTLPLPRLFQMCSDAPETLRKAVSSLAYNRVDSVAIRVEGPRPRDRGHWEYFTDESLAFTRLVYLHMFDEHAAPATGWPLLAEVTQPGEEPPHDEAELVDRVVADVVRSGVLPPGSTILGSSVIRSEPAYVVFGLETASVVADACAFLRDHDVEPLGRYGRWEYSSMGQVMRDGFAYAEGIAAECPAPAVAGAARA